MRLLEVLSSSDHLRQLSAADMFDEKFIKFLQEAPDVERFTDFLEVMRLWDEKNKSRAESLSSPCEQQ